MMAMNDYCKRTDREIKELALGIYKGEIFTSLQIRENDTYLLSTIFMPLMFMDKEQIDKMEKHKAYMFYANMSEAGPRAINGYPIFMSMNYINEEDCKKVLEKYEVIKKAIDGEMEKIPEGQVEIDFDDPKNKKG